MDEQNVGWTGRVGSGAHTVWRELTDLLLPSLCACCATYGAEMADHTDLCPRCSFLLRQSMLNVHSPRLRFQGLSVYSAGIYEHELAQAILAFKNGGRTDMLPYLGTGLNRALNKLLECTEHATASIALVPVPSEAKSNRNRGFEPAYLLAQRTLKEFQRNVFESNVARWGMSRISLLPVLRKRRSQVFARSGQKMLGVNARYRRLKNSLIISSPPLGILGFEYQLNNQACILIDDVVTTGASLYTAAQTLSDAGAQILGACTIAAVPKRSKTETISTVPVGQKPSLA